MVFIQRKLAFESELRFRLCVVRDGKTLLFYESGHLCAGWR